MVAARTILLYLWPFTLASIVAGGLALGVMQQKRNRFTANARACASKALAAVDDGADVVALCGGARTGGGSLVTQEGGTQATQDGQPLVA